MFLEIPQLSTKKEEEEEEENLVVLPTHKQSSKREKTKEEEETERKEFGLCGCLKPSITGFQTTPISLPILSFLSLKPPFNSHIITHLRAAYIFHTVLGFDCLYLATKFQYK